MTRYPRRSYYLDFKRDPVALSRRRDANRKQRLDEGRARLEAELAATEKAILADGRRKL